MTTNIKYLSFLVILFVAISCDKGNTNPDTYSGKMKLLFLHYVDGQTIYFDSLYITNEAENKYLINEIQYFISDVTLHKSDGSSQVLDEWKDILYIDTDISETQQYTFKDEINVGEYSGVSFTFGINEQKNQSLMFVNPPESYMFWPENLGGGYHYMKLNGKWMNEQHQLAPFNFHLGIGQIYHSFPDSITGFVQNFYVAELPLVNFTIFEDQTTTLNIIMNVENWFKSPNTYDHNNWGGDIMQKQDAMKQAIENGVNVFTYEAN
jgi:methanobactin biosynthesis MbnP-like protein